MHLFEAIIEANHRALSGDASAGLRPDEFPDALPLVALTCIDARLNPLIPEVLGVPEEKFIWLRNAGNIITSPMSSTMRSLALACAVKGGREICVLGHTDCLVAKSTAMQLMDRFRVLGVDRSKLPENLNEYFGLFASEHQNVIKAVEFIRHSPLIGPKIPVHGLMVDIQNGRLEWLVNGYQALEMTAGQFNPANHPAAPVPADMMSGLQDFKMGEMKFPEFKIGDSQAAGVAQSWMENAEKPRPVETREVQSQIGESQSNIASKVGEAKVRDKTEDILKPKLTLPPTTFPPVAEVDWRQAIKPSRFYKIIGSDRKQYGPIPGSKILEWLADERIDGQTPVQEQGAKDWKPLSALGKGRPTGNLPPVIPVEQPKKWG